jgi:hypothetical protein
MRTRRGAATSATPGAAALQPRSLQSTRIGTPAFGRAFAVAHEVMTIIDAQ